MVRFLIILIQMAPHTFRHGVAQTYWSAKQRDYENNRDVFSVTVMSMCQCLPFNNRDCIIYTLAAYFFV